MKKNYTFITALATFILCSGMSSPNELEIGSDKTKSNPDKAPSTLSTKPHAGIELNYKQPNNLQVGEGIDLQLSFKVRAQAEQLIVKVRHHADIQLTAQPQYEFDTKMEKQHSVTLQLTALQEGRMNIDLSATILINGKYQSRSFTIPVTVGDPTSFKAETPTPGYTVDKEHGVVSMPAMETTE